MYKERKGNKERKVWKVKNLFSKYEPKKCFLNINSLQETYVIFDFLTSVLNFNIFLIMHFKFCVLKFVPHV